MSGGGFGVSGASAVAVLGATALEGRGWASDSAVGCKAPMGGFGEAVEFVQSGAGAGQHAFF